MHDQLFAGKDDDTTLEIQAIKRIKASQCRHSHILRPRDLQGLKEEPGGLQNGGQARDHLPEIKMVK